jgi:hypothetical protein
MITTLKKLSYRTARFVYVWKKSAVKEWGALFLKHNRQVLLDAILFKHEGNKEYQEELIFLKEKKEIVPFPYKSLKTIGSVISGYDSIKKLPYVVHKDRRLYFTRSWSEEKAVKEYKNFIESENILGGSYIEKAPHQYQTESFYVKNNDLLIDAGCAEALFTLDVLDKVRKVILFESDPIWFDPIKATFEKEMASGKVVLIEKNIAEKETAKSVTLSSVLENEDYKGLFIKMDIEGYEPEVVRSCEGWMKSDKDIRFSCCTYHNEKDAEVLKAIFERNGYQTGFSDGYVLFSRDKLIKYPYFRKGIIRASNAAPTAQVV